MILNLIMEIPNDWDKKQEPVLKKTCLIDTIMGKMGLQ